MSLLDSVASLNETKSTGIVFVMGEIGSGKTTWTKTMPDAAGGDILYIPVGNDQGYNQVKGDPRFKTLVDKDMNVIPIKTIFEEKKGVRVAIKSRVTNQIIELLEEFKEGNHNFAGLNLDAISSIQEQIEEEIKFETERKVEWDGWAAIKQAMFRVYELLEEIVEDGYHVVLQSHYQIREYQDNYSGETMSRTLPMMTENNAIRVLKNAAAVVFIKVMSDPKNPTIVRRMSIVGGHPSIPTKLRNEHALSFDGILFENLDYAGCIKLMEIESLEDIEGTESLEDIKIKRETIKEKKKASGKKKSSKKQEEEDIETDDVEEVEEKPKKTKTTTRKHMRKAKQDAVESEEETDEEETVEEKPKKSFKKKPPKNKVKKVEKPEEDEVDEEEEEELEVKKTTKNKHPKTGKKKPPKIKKKVVEEEEVYEDDEEDEADEETSKAKPKRTSKKKEDKLEDDEELQDDELFDEE